MIKFPCEHCLVVVSCDTYCEPLDQLNFNTPEWRQFTINCINNKICPFCNSELIEKTKELLICSNCVEQYYNKFFAQR